MSIEFKDNQKQLTNEQMVTVVLTWITGFSTTIGGVAIIIVAWKMGFWAAMAAGIGGCMLGVPPGLILGLRCCKQMNKTLEKKYVVPTAVDSEADVPSFVNGG